MEEFFGNTAWDLNIIDLSQGQALPDSFDDIEAVISLGGPMNVYEEERFSFLKEENVFLKEILKGEIPFLGICLGAQILARAGGALIKKAVQKEAGWQTVSLTDAGRRDTLFQGLPQKFTVFQWHEDTFDIPEGGLHLASSESCVNQAFKIGKNAYGLQFHIEVTPEMVEEWMREYKTQDKEMVIWAHKTKNEFHAQANLIYLNFARIIEASQRELFCK